MADYWFAAIIAGAGYGMVFFILIIVAVVVWLVSLIIRKGIK